MTHPYDLTDPYDLADNECEATGCAATTAHGPLHLCDTPHGPKRLCGRCLRYEHEEQRNARLWRRYLRAIGRTMEVAR